MAVSQIFPGRISNALASRRIIEAFTDNQNAISKLQTQLGTGKKFLLPSEAPTAATQTLALQKLDERRAAFQQSITTNRGYLASAEQTLTSVSDAIAQARSLAQSATGDQVTSDEREGLVLEVASLIRSVIQAGNTQYAGRFLFSGTQTDQAPFEQVASGQVRYRGNTQVISGFADFGLLIDSGIDGANGLGAITEPESGDLSPVLTPETRLDALYSNTGVEPGRLRIDLDDGANHIQKEVDLSSAETIQDLKAQLENAFAGEAITLTVDIDPASLNGLRITPSAGTVQIRDVQAGRTAQELGIASPPAAVINGTDLDPGISLHTTIASLNNNTGIGSPVGTGLRIVQGNTTTIVDLDGATTIQDVLNRIREASPDVIVGIAADGKGISVASRISGSSFSIGENGGTNAAGLGLRTMTAGNQLDDLNLGSGFPRDPTPPLQIARRDGSTVEIDLQNALTVQDVLNAINAADPGVLTAGLNTVGNGISIADSSGTGELSIAQNSTSEALGVYGSDNGGATGVLAGRDVNPRQPKGALNLLIQLEQAIRDRNIPELERLAAGLDEESARVAVVRGDLGVSQRQLDDLDNRLADRQIEIQGQLEKLVDVDYAETITAFTARQQALEAYLQVAGQTQKLSVLDYL